MQCPNCNHRAESTAVKCRWCGYDPTQSPDLSITTGEFTYDPETEGASVVQGETVEATGGVVAGLVTCFGDPEDGGTPVALGLNHNRIGSLPASAICLADPEVEPSHGTIFIGYDATNPHTLTARYLDTSDRGTWVDGQLVKGQQVPLRHGSTLRLGRVVIAYSQVIRPRPDDWT